MGGKGDARLKEGRRLSVFLCVCVCVCEDCQHNSEHSRDRMGAV